VVEANIERVIARLFAVREALPAAKPTIRSHQLSLVPERRAGDYVQAMMDLGAAICTPKRPACVLCPIGAMCAARAAGNPEAYPVRAAKAERPTRRGAAFVAVRADGAVLLRKRPDDGLLGGMTEVPGTAWSSRRDGVATADDAPLAGEWRRLATPVVHVFTHFRLELDVWTAGIGDEAEAPAGCWWAEPGALAGEALPSVMKKAIEAAVSGATRRSRHERAA
jgi:A/G-specific adenine glycosylase